LLYCKVNFPILNKMNSIQKDIRLFPHTFKKKIYIVLLLLILIVVLSIAKLLPFDKELVKTFVANAFLVALLLLALTKDKDEDELTIRLRLKAFTSSFIYGVVLVIVSPYLNLLFGGDFLVEKSTTSLLFNMLFFYFYMFYLMKRSR